MFAIVLTAQNPQSPGEEEKERRILIVDDDRLNIRILSTILKTENYALAAASSGEQALDLYGGFRPDLILLDVMMPGIDGFETCRRLRSGDANCAPIVFITAKNASDDIVEGIEAGGVDYLAKPFKPKEVIARVRSHLQNRILVEQQKYLVARLSAADAAKNRFLGMAAHDLRNPLASIRAFAEFLRDGTAGPLSPEQLDLANSIHGASQAMLELVNELLDLAVIESGELNLKRQDVDLLQLLTKAAELRQIDAARKRSRIVLPESVGIRAAVDPAKVSQVIDNLISNAIKYSPPGSTIAVSLQNVPGGVAFSVRDEGAGIPENERDRLFKDFSRLSVQPTGGEKSTGLGLAICRKIVEAHGGSIAAENLTGRGCEFRVTLPTVK